MKPRDYIPPSRRCCVCGTWTERANKHCLDCDPVRRAFAIGLYERRKAGERAWQIGYAIGMSEANVGKWCRIGRRYAQEELSDATL